MNIGNTLLLALLAFSTVVLLCVAAIRAILGRDSRDLARLQDAVYSEWETTSWDPRTELLRDTIIEAAGGLEGVRLVPGERPGTLQPCPLHASWCPGHVGVKRVRGHPKVAA